MATITTEVNFTRFELTSVTDFVNDKFVIARIQLFNINEYVKEHELKLWEGKDYDTAGQFTDIWFPKRNRIKEINK